MKKDAFECPAAHVSELKSLLPKARKMLTIGWRATEEHFLVMLSNRENPLDVLTVAGGQADAESALNSIRRRSFSGRFDLASSQGFTRALEEGHITAFLRRS